MDKLWEYLISTLQWAWVDTLLQQDYLTSVGKDIVLFLTVSNILWIILGLLMLVSAYVLYKRGKKIEKKSDCYWTWGDDWVLIMFGIVLFLLIWIAMFLTSCYWLIEVITMPDIAILNYIR